MHATIYGRGQMVIPAESDGVTDLYLADLASRKGMTLATLDTGIVHPAVEIV